MNRKSDQTGILRRGTACLSCRRRKLRCDGIRPVCTPCSNMKRSQECKYDDSGRKSRTQTLREKKAVLEARLLELEANPNKHLGMPSAVAAWPRMQTDDFVDPQFANAAIYSVDFNIWSTRDYDNAFPTHDGTPFSFQFDNRANLASPSGSFIHPIDMSSQHGTLSAPLAGPPLVAPLRTFSESSGTSTQDGVFDRLLKETSPSPITSREMRDVLIESFIVHRKQCCFYSDTSRFDPSSSPSTFQSSPPNVALMNAIYLMGSFFAQIPGWECQLLEQTLHEVARSLHSTEPPADMVQALCLLAQYFFFTARDMEGNRHLSAAKRIAIDIGLHQVSPLATFPFGPEYAFDTASLNWTERSAIFWQLYMVNNYWSLNNDCCVASSTLTLPCRHISTPLPVEDGAAFETVVQNSSVHGLYEADEFCYKDLSIMAFKALASSVFDRSLRIHKYHSDLDTIAETEATWVYRHQTDTALLRLSDLIQPHTMRESLFTTERPPLDTDLYAVQTLILASTIHIHLDSTMDLKISRCGRSVVELINQLTDDDYQLLDPVLSVCWSSTAKVFHGMLDTAKQKIEINGPSASLNFAVNYLDQCIRVLLSALQKMTRTVPLADILLRNLENSHSPHYPGLRKIIPPHMEPEPEYSLMGNVLSV